MKTGRSLGSRFFFLLIDSFRELRRYKSFLLLILIISGLDKLMKYLSAEFKTPLKTLSRQEMMENAAAFLFTSLPKVLSNVSTDSRVLLVLVGAFLVKELLSMWPSSDMRRMHRRERKAFGLFNSLLAIKWYQIIWDAIAVGSICLIAAAWCWPVFVVCRFFWQQNNNSLWGIVAVCLMAAFFPLGMAGFSFSSKLAVISEGSFAEKLKLFFKLFYCPRILFPSWGFYTCRAVLELLVIGIIPFTTQFFINYAALRIALNSLIACPVYSYLKMLSFKFFLEMYKPEKLVRDEYLSYFAPDCP